MNIPRYEYEVRKLDFQCDEFGPEDVFEVFDPLSDKAIGWVVIDNTAAASSGVGKGGTAMYQGCSLDITLRKARVMSMKQIFCSPIGKISRYNRWGGAKGGINYDSSRPDAENVLRGWAKALNKAGVIPSRYIFGLDVGLKEWASKAVVEELGDSRAATGKPEALGGIPYDDLGLTGYGLLIATKIMMLHRGLDIGDNRASIVIQGIGAVGSGFMGWLEKMYPNGARVIAVSDKNGALFSTWGLRLSQCREILSNPVINDLPKGIYEINKGDELYLPSDCLLLAYKEDQITVDNVDKIKASIIVEGANRGVDDEASGILRQITDFVINCGASVSVYVEHANGSIEEAMTYIEEVISNNVNLILRKSEEIIGVSPRKIAEMIALDEIRAAVK